MSVAAVDSGIENRDDVFSIVATEMLPYGLGGIAVMVLALIVPDVVAALTIAYAILVGGLLVPIIGAMTWRRGTGIGAACSMLAGTVVTLGTMIYLEITAENPLDGVFANEPIYFGLLASAVVFIVGSLLSKPTPDDVWQAWKHRSKHGVQESDDQPPVAVESAH